MGGLKAGACKQLLKAQAHGVCKCKRSGCGSWQQGSQEAGKMLWKRWGNSERVRARAIVMCERSRWLVASHVWVAVWVLQHGLVGNLGCRRQANPIYVKDELQATGRYVEIEYINRRL